MNTIITVDGITIDFAKVVGIELENRYFSGQTQIRVIFSTRKEYVYNPETCGYDIHEITDEAHFPYPEYEQAQRVIEDMTNEWIKIRK